MDLNTVIAAIAPQLLTAIGALLTVLIGWAADTARRRWGIQIEQAHREALHSAIMTGIKLALQRGMSGPQAAELAVGYARASVPDAIAALGARDDVLANLARAKMGDMR
ncbi:hypothetical protein GCM10011452_09090 [Gemmobacter lanyuensis]|uniref:Bacteriophage holin of superfamily 6 (Holin_LLH) n=1 Tax=Gemmobacter lanyuensis TaxID=1054497 RepID=A0A918MH69_9RHOB|nr:hypothetical protein [Gemmobacter lanyuensis]GGW23921.1 hypothetical protein GCM10011452_09090 [Gemmobacter lanyuensis]